LEQLRECSLISAGDDSGDAEEMRFGMLETVREYGRLQLSDREQADLGRRHAERFLALGEGRLPGVPRRLSAGWLRRLDAELGNLRAALDWFGAADDGAELGARLATGLRRLWVTRGRLTEGLSRLSGALSQGGRVKQQIRGRALAASSWLAYLQGDMGAGERLGLEALAVCEEVGDEIMLLDLFNTLGCVAQTKGDFEAARAYHEKCIAQSQALGNEDPPPASLCNLGLIATDPKQKQSFFEQALAVERKRGARGGLAVVHLGILASQQGRYAEARALLSESLTANRDLGNVQGIMQTLEGFGVLAVAEGQVAKGARLFAAAQALREAAGAPILADERDARDAGIAAAQEALGRKGFAAVWAEGQAMPQEEAIEYALSADNE
jgi:tetratricopeptide (TPR) repeat protein